jgi:hypothetical protein
LGATLGVAAIAGATPGRVENRCPRLSEAGYEELDARVQLLLRSDSAERPLPAVVCAEEGSWVEWQGRRLPIVGRGLIEDEVVDIVEKELHGAAREAEADPRRLEDAAVAAGEPMLERGGGSAPAAPASARPADPVALRAVGPSFDFGASVGPLTIGGREAVRVTTSGRRVMFMDFQAMLGIGAPLNPDKRFGAVARFGAEWMVVYPEGNSGQAAVVPLLDFGLRVQHPLRWISLWGGLDVHLRLSTLALYSSSTIAANDTGGGFTLGVAFVDWSRK